MIEIQLRQEEAAANKSAIPTVLKARWKGPEAPNAKGILHAPLAGLPMGNRDVLLTATAKARAWIADLAEGRAASFAEIAKREGKVERHIRLLAPLAFVSPQLVFRIIDGHVPSVAVTALAKQVTDRGPNSELTFRTDKSSFEPVSDSSNHVSVLKIRIWQVSDRRLSPKFGT
jgi:hypothetical protein